MISFRQYLTELFDKPAKWVWISKRGTTAAASFTTTHDNTIIVEFVESPGIGETVEFKLSDKTMHRKRVDADALFSLTGTGDAVQILATMKEIVGEFLKQHHPPILSFTAEGKSRMAAYGRWFNRTNYSGYQKHTGSPVTDKAYYLWTKDGLDPNTIKAEAEEWTEILTDQ